MDARVIVITIMQKFGEKSVYFGWFMAISKGGLNQPPPHSSYIQKPRTIRVKADFRDIHIRQIIVIF